MARSSAWAVAIALWLLGAFGAPVFAQPQTCEDQQAYWQEYTQTLAVSRNRAEQEMVDVRVQLKRLQALHDSVAKELKDLKEKMPDAQKP